MSAATDVLTEPSARRRYHRVTRTATYGFLASLPLLILYETMMLVSGLGATTQVRVGAEVWTKQLLNLVGVRGTLALSVVVVLVGVALAWHERRRDIPIRARYFGWIVAESALYAVGLAMVIGSLVGWLFAWGAVELPLAQAAPRRPGYFTMLALSIGAGLYEELIFRVVLVGGLYLIFRNVAPDGAYLTAAIIGAFIFSAVHYMGPLGDAFAMSSFVFRFLFGLALNALFLWRGFAVAAWTHALYDVFVVTRMMM